MSNLDTKRERGISSNLFFFLVLLMSISGLKLKAQNWVPISWADVQPTDVVLVTMNTTDGSYALPNNGGVTTPKAVSVTMTNGMLTINTENYTESNLLWNINRTAGKIYPNQTTTTWLYTTDSNNGVRIGTTTNGSSWNIDNGYLKTSINSKTRYLGIYLNTPDWRAYTNTTGNTVDQSLSLYKKVVTTTSVAIPTFNPTPGVYSTTQSVIISCATANATIHYTLDGTTPTTSSSVYQSPLTISQNTTIKAMAVKADMANSEVASGTYEIQSLMSIAEARALPLNTMALVQGVVTFIEGRNVVIQDNTGGINLYLNSGSVPTSLALGDLVKAFGKRTTYNGLAQLSNINGGNDVEFKIQSSGNPLPLAIKSVAEILAGASDALQSTRVKIVGGKLGTININGNTALQQNNSSVNIYKGAALNSYSAGDYVNVIATIGYYNAAQLRITTSTDIAYADTIYYSSSALSSFNYNLGEGPSESQQLIINGRYLNGDVVVTVPSPFEVAITETGPYATTTTLTPSDGILNQTAVYVRLAAGLDKNTYNGSMTIASAHHTDSISLQGEVINNLTFRKISSPALITNNDIYMIVDLTTSRALTSANGSSSAPTAVPVTIQGDSISGDINESLQWKFSISQSGYIIYPANNANVWLYSTTSNNGVRVGTNNNKYWELGIISNNYEGLKNIATSRYMGVYNQNDWRTYTTIHNNIASTKVAYFILGEVPIPGTVTTPTFSLDAGEYLSQQEVVIETETEDANIYYTLDGSDPTANSTLYEAPISLNTTTTIKAIATKDGMIDSEIVSATYTFPTTISIAEARSLQIGATAVINGVVTFIDDRTVYVQDETAAIALNLNANTMPQGLTLGDLVKAKGIRSTYKGLEQMSNINGSSEQSFIIVSSDNTLPETETTIATILQDFAGDNILQSTRVKIIDAVVGNINNNGNTPITQDGSTVNIYKLPVIEGLLERDWITMTGIVSCYNTIQLRVNSADDVSYVHRPRLTATPATLGGFNYVVNDGPSEAKSFILSASYLRGIVSINVPESYELSFAPDPNFIPENPGVIWPPSSGTILGLKVYVRLKAGLDEGTYADALEIVSPDADTLLVSLNGVVVPQGFVISDYVRISNVSELTQGDQIVFAARHDSIVNSYYAMKNTASGKPSGVLFASETSEGQEILPTTITDNENNYVWVVGVANNGYTFTNVAGETLGYISSTNFAVGGSNTSWAVSRGTSADNAMVESYTAFNVINANVTGRAVALNTSHNFGPYAVSNMTGSNAASYNFFLDIFKKSGSSVTPTVATPTFTPAAGLYYEPIMVTITCATEDATIRYTLDGTEPNEESLVYTEPITVNESVTIKAIAFKEEYTPSAVAEAAYNIQTGVAVIFNQDWEGEMNGWSFVSVEGSASWQISSQANNHYAYINAYNQGVNIDWCISPSFNLDEYENPILTFVSAKNYNGPDMEVFFSNDYNGTTPATATWTPLTAELSTGSWSWTPSGNISLSDFSGTNCYIGFKYTSTASSAAGWEIDDILLVGQTTNPYITVAPAILSGFSYIEGNGPSTTQSFVVSANNIETNINIIPSDNYEISLTDGETFVAEDDISIHAINGIISETTIYVRLKEGLAAGSYNGESIVTSYNNEISVNVICNGAVTEQGSDDDWIRISAVTDLIDGAKVIVASRYDTNIGDGYYVMTASTTGKPEGVLCNSIQSGDFEILPPTIANNAGSYYWNVNLVEGGVILTTAQGDTLGYGGSGTNFVNGGTNTIWNINTAVSGENAMVPSYMGFNITNVNVNNRAIAQNSSHNFGPYSTSNVNSGDYNFFQDLFVQGAIGAPTVSAPSFNPAGGTYYENQSVTLSTTTEGATIYYSTSSENGPWETYSATIEVNESMTIWAYGEKEGYNNSAVVSASYIINNDIVIIFNQDWEGDWNGWTSVNVEGSAEYSISSYGNNHYAYINGYNEGANEDWLLSPAFNLNEYGDATLTFRTAMNFTGPALEVYFSNDYDGNDPTTATWQALECSLSTGSWNWMESGEISLAAYDGDNCYIGFKYTCSETEAAAWEIDDIMLVSGNSMPSLSASPSTLSGMTYLEGNGPSTSISYTLIGSNLLGTGNIDIEVTDIFEISSDDITYTASLSLPYQDGILMNQPVTLYVRMKADLTAGAYQGTITHEGGEAQCVVTLNGQVIGENEPGISQELLPLYIQGMNGTNNNRLPFAFRLTLSNLTPNATYRYINQVVDSNDGATANGAGNIIYVNNNDFFRTTSPSLENEGGYGVFTTDAQGSYSGWFMTEATANTRFTPGNQVYMRVRLNDGNDGTSAVHYFTTTGYATVLSYGTENNEYQGTAIRGTSQDEPKNFVFLYDNINRDGRPLYGTSIEAIGIDYTSINQYATFYKENVAGVDGAWGGIVPNMNANGVQYIAVMDLEGGNLINSYISDDGIWGEANTVNPAGGLTEVLVINLEGLGIDDNKKGQVSIWMAYDEIIIENLEEEWYMLDVYNVLGQPVMSKKIEGGNNTRIAHHLDAGIYVISIRNNTNAYAGKLIVR